MDFYAIFFSITLSLYKSAIQCEILEKERDEANKKLSRMEEGEISMGVF